MTPETCEKFEMERGDSGWSSAYHEPLIKAGLEFWVVTAWRTGPPLDLPVGDSTVRLENPILPTIIGIFPKESEAQKFVEDHTLLSALREENGSLKALVERSVSVAEALDKRLDSVLRAWHRRMHPRSRQYRRCAICKALGTTRQRKARRALESRSSAGDLGGSSRSAVLAATVVGGESRPEPKAEESHSAPAGTGTEAGDMAAVRKDVHPLDATAPKAGAEKRRDRKEGR